MILGTSVPKSSLRATDGISPVDNQLKFPQTHFWGDVSGMACSWRCSCTHAPSASSKLVPVVSGPGCLVGPSLLFVFLGLGIVVLAVFRRRFAIGEFIFFRDCGGYIQRLGMVGAHGWGAGGYGSPLLRRSRGLRRGRSAGQGGAGRCFMGGSCGLTASRSYRCRV